MVTGRNFEGQSDMDFGETKNLQRLLQEFEKELVLLTESPGNPEFQCNVCLTSRSTFTEFYSVCESIGEILESEAELLRSFLSAAVESLPKGGKYHRSVYERLMDFEDFCSETQNRDQSDTCVPVP